jgi:hypothetical protein
MLTLKYIPYSSAIIKSLPPLLIGNAQNIFPVANYYVKSVDVGAKVHSPSWHCGMDHAFALANVEPAVNAVMKGEIWSPVHRGWSRNARTRSAPLARTQKSRSLHCPL